MDFNFDAPLEPPPALAELLEAFDSWGSAVEHFLFATSAIADRDAHFRAAMSALETSRVRLKRGSPQVLFEPKIHWQNVDSTRGATWTPQQFFGPDFDVTTREVQVQLNQRPRSEFSGYSYFVSEGYAHCILDPPHGLSERGLGDSRKKFTPREFHSLQTRSFLALCDALFGDLETIEVVSWPTDFSTGFEDGLEWWGSYLWTVYAPSKHWIVAIVASSTD